MYTAGKPAWETADTSGAWLANHTPPSAALFVPANRAPGGKPLVYLGSFVTEGTARVGLGDAIKGRKQGGVYWVGGAWTGAQFLARDDGPSADKDLCLRGRRVAPMTPHGRDKKAGEIRLPPLPVTDINRL